ncbi:hypothetical protein KJ591_01245, partial [Patescibacteria group bacterium]|nr:hypothetical protein [Patescibacteria group bacterium]
DDKDNVYLDIAYEHGSIWDDDSYLDHFIFKYNKDGGLLAEIDRSTPLQKLFEKPKAKILANYETNGYYVEGFKKIRVTSDGNIYWMASFKDKGIKIFKYSQTK